MEKYGKLSLKISVSLFLSKTLWICLAVESQLKKWCLNGICVNVKFTIWSQFDLTASICWLIHFFIVWISHLCLILCWNHLGPVVQTIISLTSSLRVSLLTVLQLFNQIHVHWNFLLKKWEKLLHCKSFSNFFGKKILAYLRFEHLKFSPNVN